MSQSCAAASSDPLIICGHEMFQREATDEFITLPFRDDIITGDDGDNEQNIEICYQVKESRSGRFLEEKLANGNMRKCSECDVKIVNYDLKRVRNRAVRKYHVELLMKNNEIHLPSLEDTIPEEVRNLRKQIDELSSFIRSLESYTIDSNEMLVKQLKVCVDLFSMSEEEEYDDLKLGADLANSLHDLINLDISSLAGSHQQHAVRAQMIISDISNFMKQKCATNDVSKAGLSQVNLSEVARDLEGIFRKYLHKQEIAEMKGLTQIAQFSLTLKKRLLEKERDALDKALGSVETIKKNIRFKQEEIRSIQGGYPEEFYLSPDVEKKYQRMHKNQKSLTNSIYRDLMKQALENSKLLALKKGI
jgi:hypothetical protein